MSYRNLLTGAVARQCDCDFIFEGWQCPQCGKEFGPRRYDVEVVNQLSIEIEPAPPEREGVDGEAFWNGMAELLKLMLERNSSEIRCPGDDGKSYVLRRVHTETVVGKFAFDETGPGGIAETD